AVHAGAAEMRAMLRLELEGRGEAALGIADGWQRAAAPLVAEGSVDGFDFADRPSELPAIEEGDISIDEAKIEVLGEDEEQSFHFGELDASAIDRELAPIFHQEARGLLAVIAKQLATFAADGAAARELERSFHSLKGAAATVGLTRVSEAAAALQNEMEAIVDAGRAARPDEVAAIQARTEAL